MSGPGIICDEEDGQCELCGAIEDTRPYGPNGEEVCFDCGKKDQAAIDRGIEEHVFGKGRARRKPKLLMPKEMN